MLDRDDLIDGLTEIVAELRARGQHAGIRIVGGAALALRYFDRGTTVDIDAAIHPASGVLEISAQIASRRGWPEDWVNTNATMFIPPFGGGWEPIYDVAGITISVASPQMLLAMKLNASRPGRDDDDIAQLLVLCGITSPAEAEELFETFYPGEIPQEKAFRVLGAIFFAGLPGEVETPPLPNFTTPAG